MDPLRKARDYMHLGNYNAAKKIYRDLSSGQPKNDRLHFQLGLCYLADKEFHEAKRQFEACVKLNSDNLEALIELGDIYFKLGDDQRALLSLRKACNIDCGNSRVHTYLARLYEHLDNYVKAIEHYSMAIEEGSASESPRHDLALAYAHNGDYLEGYLLLQDLLDEAALSLLWIKINQTEENMVEFNVTGSEDHIKMLKEEMDWVEELFYCRFEYSILYTKNMLEALERFLDLSEEQIRIIHNEIVLLSCMGVSFSDDVWLYELQSLGGEFSGFQLGCYLFTSEQLTHGSSRMPDIYHQSFSQALDFLLLHS